MSGCCFGFESSSGASSGGVTGSGTLNYVPKWSPDGTTLGNSQIYDNGIGVAIGTNTPIANTLFTLKGTSAVALAYTAKFVNSSDANILSLENNKSAIFGGSIYIENNQSFFAKNSGGTYENFLTARSSTDNVMALNFGAGGFSIRNTSLVSALYIDNTNNNFGIGFSFGSPIPNKCSIVVANTEADGIRIRNTSASNGAGEFIIVAGGANGFGVPGWANSSIIENENTGSLVLGSYLSDIKFQTGARVITMTLNSIGNLGIGIASPTARTHIQGVDATSSNYALKVDNSASATIAHFRNDKFVGLGTADRLIGAFPYNFEALSTIVTDFGVGKYFSASFMSSETFGINKGGGISFGGKWTSGGAYTSFGGINAVKANATDGSFSGKLNLWVRDDAATGAVAFTSIAFGNKVRNGMGTGVPTALLHLDGDNADVFISEAKCINTTGYASKLLANTVNTQNNVALFAQATNGLKNYAAIFEGNINTNIQIGNVGLASGDLYVDTAANILLNGDLVVGRKV